MYTNAKRPTPLKAVAVALAATPLLVPTTAVADIGTDAARLKCRAHMSDSTPAQYSNVFVRVKAAPRATVKTIAHYKTTDTKRHGRANLKGRASIKYYISGATPGYKVKVDVTVTKRGRSKSCSTSFRPHQ